MKSAEQKLRNKLFKAKYPEGVDIFDRNTLATSRDFWEFLELLSLKDLQELDGAWKELKKKGMLH